MKTNDTIQEHLKYLKLPYIGEQFSALCAQAGKEQWSHHVLLERLIAGEVLLRQQHALERRIRNARFPKVKTLEQFKWDWPKKINRQQVQHAFQLGFVKEKTNVILLGGVGVGKTHIASALAYHACHAGYSVLFTQTIDVINNLLAANAQHKLKTELSKYINPEVLVLDELGYLPLDKTGVELLFQIISQRYERSATIITSNKVYKQWPTIFNNDSTITTAILDRLVHCSETIIIEGRSYRTKDQVCDPPSD